LGKVCVIWKARNYDIVGRGLDSNSQIQLEIGGKKCVDSWKSLLR
jgi:hypothetical protein